MSELNRSGIVSVEEWQSQQTESHAGAAENLATCQRTGRKWIHGDPPVQSYRDADDGAMRRNLLSFDVQKLARIKQDVTQPGQRPVIGIFRRNIGRSVAR